MGSLLTGSGSAVYGLAESERHAHEIRRSLGGEVWSNVLRTLPDGVMAAHDPLEVRVKVRILVGQPVWAGMENGKTIVT